MFSVYGIVGVINCAGYTDGDIMKKSKSKEKPEKLVRVIVDTSNTYLDKFIPESQAKEMYERGELGWDLTNRTYCTINRSIC